MGLVSAMVLIIFSVFDRDPANSSCFIFTAMVLGVVATALKGLGLWDFGLVRSPIDWCGTRTEGRAFLILPKIRARGELGSIGEVGTLWLDFADFDRVGEVNSSTISSNRAK
jgi:hypothetical protein